MKRLLAIILGLLTLPLDAAEVTGMRIWPDADRTRIVFDLSGAVSFKSFRMNAPERVVIDLRSSRLVRGLKLNGDQHSIIKGVRSASRNGKDLRMVLDMRQSADAKAFTLKPNESYGHRLVVDLEHPASAKQAVPAKSAPAAAAVPATPRKAVASHPAAGRDIIIAIDAGHGGQDPGAMGQHGTREKDVVMSIARRLKSHIDRERGMKAVLIRDGDYFIGLRQRIEKARKLKADLFVSIHADAFRDHRVRGSSVYVLSRRGASSEAARWLAERENAADLVGGVSLNDKDDLLRSVLLDLSQTATSEASVVVADKVLHGLKGIGKVHKKSVQHAGFVVLKSPDIPSILVETAFISNSSEERKLRDHQHQEKLARAITRGVRNYFQRHAPAGTLMAMKQHRVAAGETLSGIAQRYDVSTDHLKSENRLSNDLVQAGVVLRIPSSDS